MTVSDCFVGNVLHHAKSNVVIEFVHSCRVLGWPRCLTATFEDHNRKRSPADNLLGHQQTRPSTANNGYVNGL
jgi:hypothetical protein